MANRTICSSNISGNVSLGAPGGVVFVMLLLALYQVRFLSVEHSVIVPTPFLKRIKYMWGWRSGRFRPPAAFPLV